MRFHVRTNQAPDEDPYERYTEDMRAEDLRRFWKMFYKLDNGETVTMPDDAYMQVMSRQPVWNEPPVIITLVPPEQYL